MKILIHSHYKSGTNKLRQTFGINGYFCENQLEGFRECQYENYGNYVMCEHSLPLTRAVENDRTYDYVFCGIRRPSEVMLSALFQNITSEGWSYAYGPEKKVKDSHPLQILNHLFKQLPEMITMSHLRPECNFRRINEACVDLGLDPIPEPDYKGNSIVIQRGNRVFRNIVFYKFDSLTDGSMEKFMNCLGLKWNGDKVNDGEDKWYQSLYKECKLALPFIRDAIRERENYIVEKYGLN